MSWSLGDAHVDADAQMTCHPESLCRRGLYGKKKTEKKMTKQTKLLQAVIVDTL